ncbi:MAG: hypothetical protein Q9164_003412 [Protoblastenia rupestris]
MKYTHRLSLFLLGISQTSCGLAQRYRGGFRVPTTTTAVPSVTSVAIADQEINAAANAAIEVPADPVNEAPITSSTSSTATNSGETDNGITNNTVDTEDTDSGTGLADSTSGTYCITMVGNVDYSCSISGGAFTGDCTNGGKVCSSGTNLDIGGGKIALTAPGADPNQQAVTLIECFFPNAATFSGGNKGTCDISMVDGYTYDAVCTGTVSFGYQGTLWKPSEPSYGCTGDAVLDEANSACLDPIGRSLYTVDQAPAFFQPAGNGAIVAAYQSGSLATLEGQTADITCTVSGGMPNSAAIAKREASDAALVERGIMEVGDREAARRHYGPLHVRGPHAHTGGMRHLLAGSK